MLEEKLSTLSRTISHGYRNWQSGLPADVADVGGIFERVAKLDSGRSISSPPTARLTDLG